MNNSRSIVIRRYIAILLMALTLVFLFWPSFFSINAKNAYSGADEGYTESFFEYRSAITETMKSASEVQGKMPSWGFSVIALNAAFFALIVLSTASIVLMSLTKSKVTVILHTVLSFVTVIGVALYWGIAAAGASGNGFTFSFAPGAAMFLLPLCSLAASILYKRDKNRNGASPASAEQPE